MCANKPMSAQVGSAWLSASGSARCGARRLAWAAMGLMVLLGTYLLGLGVLLLVARVHLHHQGLAAALVVFDLDAELQPRHLLVLVGAEACNAAPRRVMSRHAGGGRSASCWLLVLLPLLLAGC